jgi:hypothetical protein
MGGICGLAWLFATRNVPVALGMMLIIGAVVAISAGINTARLTKPDQEQERPDG